MKDKAKQPTYTWATQKIDLHCKIVDCPTYDPYKDFRRDNSGHYVLIRPDFTNAKIEVAICNKDHVVVAVFRGSKCQDVYEAIFQYEKKHKCAWFNDKGHVAYLGKELKKVELALALGQNNYFQE